MQAVVATYSTSFVEIIPRFVCQTEKNPRRRARKARGCKSDYGKLQEIPKEIDTQSWSQFNNLSQVVHYNFIVEVCTGRSTTEPKQNPACEVK